MCGNPVFFKDGKFQYQDENGICYDLIIQNKSERGRRGSSGSRDSIYVDIINSNQPISFSSIVSSNATLPLTYKWDVSSSLGFPLGTFFELNNGSTMIVPLVDIEVNGPNNLPSVAYSINTNAVNAGLVKLTVTDAQGRIARDYRMVFSYIP